MRRDEEWEREGHRVRRRKKSIDAPISRIGIFDLFV